MRHPITLFTALTLLAGSLSLQAQFAGGGGSGPQLNPEMLKLFGEHKAFSADLEFRVTQGGQTEPLTMPGKIAIQDGQSRFEMDLTAAKGGKIPPNAAAQMKQMGMDKMVVISLPEKKLSLLVYPGLEAYVEMPLEEDAAAAADSTRTVTELGKETIAGRECIKNKVIVTRQDGQTHEATTWNAIDLQKFPVKIETTEEGNLIGLQFTEVKLAKPEANSFRAPANYKRYGSMMDMMQEVMMKRMGGAVPDGK